MTRLLDPLFHRRTEPPRANPSDGGAGFSAEKMGYLRATDIFQDLSPVAMVEIDRMTALTTCRRGRVIFAPGQTGEVLFILKKGRVQISRITADGRKLVTATVGPGTVLGEMSLIAQGMGGSFAEAAEDCVLCVMSRSDVERLLLNHPRVALRLIEVLAARLAQAEERLEAMAFRRVAGRVAATLLVLAGDGEREIVGISHQEIAEQVGTFRETTTRVLNEFRARGLIELRRLRIRILDPDGLRRLTEG